MSTWQVDLHWEKIFQDIWTNFPSLMIGQSKLWQFLGYCGNHKIGIFQKGNLEVDLRLFREIKV